jgi:hypothetical protein
VVIIAIIAGYALLELDMGEVSNQLGENGSAGIHPPLFRRYGVRRFQPIPAIFSSNRFLAERHLFY